MAEVYLIFSATTHRGFFPALILVVFASDGFLIVYKVVVLIDSGKLMSLPDGG